MVYNKSRCLLILDFKIYFVIFFERVPKNIKKTLKLKYLDDFEGNRFWFCKRIFQYENCERNEPICFLKFLSDSFS